MGCRLTRTESTELCEQTAKEDEKQGNVSNGQPKVMRKDTPAHGHEHLRNGYSANSSLTASKPIGEVESASQADFFRMLDAKIAHGADLDSENEA
ncbi:hypothetical protein ANCCEY_00408 [Ancylostoma ceylanicum]|uniref:Uncharacterized protein n=2 Tax=Ancylostoma TaxID=29169 RepID=A0A0D6MBN5_9BILA|nr:hypothetical protein ANCCEY_00408 [Ancylostoma ceylanicum]RCN27434.1 hypothetical protein ANCCAN_26831 [Ancylostoma caninum]